MSDPVATGRDGRFHTTRWSMVLLSGEEGRSHESEAALENLCRVYWYPLYAYIRRRGYAPHQAQDLTQGYFEKLLEKKFLSSVDADKGKFRSFLLASLNHFLANEWNRANAQKRGGGKELLSLDAEAGEKRYQLEPPDDLSPDKLFDRKWADALLAQVLERLEGEYRRSGKTAQFAELKRFLTGVKGDVPYEESARRLELSLSAVKSAIRRLRIRYGALIRDEIAQTVEAPEQVEAELQDLFKALSD